MLILTLASWALSHKTELLEIAGAGYTLLSLIVAALPQSASKNKLIALLEKASVLSHKDSPGTLKAPGTSAVREVIPPASSSGSISDS